MKLTIKVNQLKVPRGLRKLPPSRIHRDKKKYVRNKKLELD